MYSRVTRMSEWPSNSCTTAKGDALVECDRRGRVPHRVHPGVRDAGLGEDARPFLPVGARVDRPAVLLAPDQIVVLPYVRRGQPLTGLRRPVLPERGDQLREQRDGLAAAFLDLAEDQAAAAALRALRRVGRSGPSRRKIAWKWIRPRN